MEANKNTNSLHEGYSLHWYEIKSIIGRGGFGITYLANDKNLDRYVAIKEFMPEDFAIRESDSTVHPKTGEQENLYKWGLERFIKEAQTLAKFNHPNIVRVQSVFEANNTAYMVMEYAQGEDLATVYKKNSKFTEEEFLDTFIPVMDGLVLVHNSGFIHRDIKPANIYICDDDSPLLLDFGSARQSLGGKTKALTSLVTYGYAPYEQYNEGSEKQGPWTDIYSLGACIYVGITGQKPVDALQRGGSFLETGIDSYQPLSVRAKGEYSENFLLAVDNALMFKISDRPQNIVDWADMLMGKIQLPNLPKNMFKPPENEDKTRTELIQTTNSKANKTPLRGTQGLIDAHSNRNAKETGTKLLKNRKAGTEIFKRADTSSVISSKYLDGILNLLGRVLPKTEKPWLPIAIGSVATVFVVFSLSWYFSDSSSPVESNPQSIPELTKTPQERAQNSSQESQQVNKQLEQLIENAEQALARKKYVTPENNNARYFYQQTLKIDPDNEAAKTGIKNIESQLLKLAKNNYDNGDITTAQQYLKQLYIVNPKSEGANKLDQIIQKKLKSTTTLNELLIKAGDRFDKNEYTKPDNDNAFYFYQQALLHDAKNKTAKKGIKNIEKQLLNQANATYINEQYDNSLDYLAQLLTVNPNSKDAKSLQNKINKKQSQQSQIESWLTTATKQKNRNRYTSPKNDNAYDTYNKILQLEPNNKQALDGLKNIEWYYRTQFKQHISTTQLSKAENDISIMKKIAAPSATINQMQNELKTSKRKQSAKKPKNTAKKISMNLASEKVGQFKSSIESNNKNKLKSVSQFKPGREQFVDQLFSQYKKIIVKVTNFQLIPKENKALAKIELTDLIDKNDVKVTPGSWNKFDIIIKYNNKNQLKVHW